MVEHENDLRLVRRALERNAKAVEELGARMSCVPRLVAGANRRLNAGLAGEEQDDLVQDVILLLWQRLETFEGRSTLEGWAWTYVHFQTRNKVRALARARRNVALDPDYLSQEPMSSNWPDIFNRETIEHLLDRLPEAMATTIRLKYFEGLKFKEVAERMNISENTAKTRYYRGLVRAREVLEEMGLGERADD